MIYFNKDYTPFSIKRDSVIEKICNHIIDAGMRELNTTGYMHNSVRMIVASFLTMEKSYKYKKLFNSDTFS